MFGRGELVFNYWKARGDRGICFKHSASTFTTVCDKLYTSKHHIHKSYDLHCSTHIPWCTKKSRLLPNITFYCLLSYVILCWFLRSIFSVTTPMACSALGIYPMEYNKSCLLPSITFYCLLSYVILRWILHSISAITTLMTYIVLHISHGVTKVVCFEISHSIVCCYNVIPRM